MRLLPVWVLPGPQDPRVNKAHRESRAQLARKGLRGRRVHRVHRGNRVCRAFQVYRVSQGLKAMSVLLELMVWTVRRANRVCRERGEMLESQACRVRQAHVGHKVKVGEPGPPGPPGETVLIPTSPQPPVSVPPIAPRSSSLPPAPTISVANRSDPPLESNTQPRGNCARYNEWSGEHIDWLEKAYPDYSICYTEEYARDVGPVSHWLAEIRGWLFAKYDIDELSVFNWNRAPAFPAVVPMELYIMLIPEADGKARVGYTQFWCCEYLTAPSMDAVAPIGWIPYLTLSNPDWQRYPCLGRLCNPHNQGYIKDLMHEFTHAVQRTVAERLCASPEGCPNHGDTHWSSEALAEYEGTFNTTAHNRTTTFEKLIEYVSDNDLIYLATSLDYRQSLRSADAYVGGNLLMKFLADRFGEDIHYRLTHSEVSTLEDVLLAEYEAEGVSGFDLFAELKAWMESQESQ